ncbi:cyclic nucleotide-gated ion channel [Microbaculum marinum]|uniref:Cyclic nucleotide-gated ion channel n=1 Tax=Microbaculum marinum TaxID=1764581 RepID=A0AAW9RZB5_9HYPH
MIGWFAAIFASGRTRGRGRHAAAVARTPRKAAYDIIEEGPTDRLLPKLVDAALIVLICVNVAAVCFETVPALDAEYHRLFAVIELVSVAIFTIEYVVRLWVAPEHMPYSAMPPGRARLKYALTPYALIDLLAILPFYLSFIVPVDLRLLRVFRLVRFFKLARYSTGLRSLVRAVRTEWRALAASLIIMAGMVLVAAAVMYAVERNAQPDAFGSIPQALWWAVVTLTTVGYGDVVPLTPGGRVLGGVIMLFGLAMFALPLGIVATAFVQEVHRREFVVNWGMVARVPLFATLNASEIAEIMNLLKARTLPPGSTVVRRGEVAEAMYFIASGEVQLDLKDSTVRLGAGDFFGEIAVLKKSRRSATVVAVTRVNLLVLSADDFHVLLERNPDIGQRIRKIADARLGRERVVRGGDIIAEELGAGPEEPGG